MNTLPDFELGTELISESLSLQSDSFHEFVEAINDIYHIDDSEMYLEKVVDRNLTLKQSAGQVIGNTVSTTRNVAGAAGNIIDANANVIKTGWDIIMRAIQLASRIIHFISNKIADIPKMIGFLWRKISRIPPNIKNKISGNLTLYISAAEIEQLYNTNLFARVDQYVTLAESLAKGDMWGTMLSRRGKDGKTILGDNDIKICRKMDVIYHELKNVEFHQSTINMKAEGNVDLYFGDAKSIKFKDLSRKQFECTYYEAISKLVEDMKGAQAKLEIIDQKLGAKYDRTKANQAFGNLNIHQQRIVTSMLQHTAKIIAIIGSLMKCVMADMKEIETAVANITKYQKIKTDNSAVKAAQKEADAAQKAGKEASKK